MAHQGWHASGINHASYCWGCSDLPSCFFKQRDAATRDCLELNRTEELLQHAIDRQPSQTVPACAAARRNNLLVGPAESVRRPFLIGPSA